MKHLNNFEEFNESKLTPYIVGAALTGATLMGADAIMNPTTKATSKYQETELAHFPEFYVKLFEEFDLGREEIIDFFEDTELVEVKDLEIVSLWHIVTGRKGPLGGGKEYRVHYSTYNLWGDERFMDFISRSNGFDKRHSYLRETEVMIVDLDFYHPQMTRSSGFQYKEYIISMIKNYTERIHKGYDMDIFLYISNIDWMSDPIAKLTLVIVNKD